MAPKHPNKSNISDESTDDELLDFDDADLIIDMNEQALVKRHAMQLADAKGEWMLPEGGELANVDDDADNSQQTNEEADISSDLYTAFVREATRIARISEEEEHALGTRVRDFSDDKAAKKLVLHNMRLAIKMAHQYRRSWTNLMDLVQEASAGMSIAAKRWDPDMGTRFGTYAAYWIRAQLTKFLMTNSRLIHTGNTRAGRRVYFSLPQIRRRLLAQGKEPTAEFIAQETGEDPKEVALILSRLEGREASLSAPLGSETINTLQDTIESPSDNPEEQTSRQQVQQTIQKIVIRFQKNLSNERDIAIWNEHLISNNPLSLVELGARYGVSKQRMGQLATRLKRLFRRHVIDELGPNTQLSWLFDE
jgi:RNA polymerase sigma-32 factor